MIIFEKVELLDVFSHRETTVALSGFTGPVLVVGENRDSESCDSNGSGKSAIFETVVWALFGQTLRGVGSREVVRKGSPKGGGAWVYWRIEGEGNRDGSYTVGRFQDHPKWKNSLLLYKNGDEIPVKEKRETQHQIEEILGTDFNLFVESVILGQDSISFATATDAEKKRILEHVAQLEKFDVFLNITKQRLSEILVKQTSLGTEVVRLTATRGELVVALQRAERNAATFESERVLKIQALEQAQAELTTQGRSEEIVRKDLQHLADQDFGVEGLETELREVTDTYTTLVQRIGEVSGILKGAKKQVLDSEIALKSVKEMCPTCKRPFDRESLEVTKKQLREQLDVRKSRVVELELELDSLTAKQEVAVSQLGESREQFQEARSLESIRQRKIGELKIELTQISGQQFRLGQIRHEIETERIRVNPHVQEVEELKGRIVDCESELTKLENAREDLVAQVQYLDFWVKGFGKKGVRGLVLDQVANALNHFVAKYSQYLTDGEIEVQFSTQRELVSGDYTEDFSVRGLNRHGADVYKGNSVGERQRVDMAIALALQDLIRSRLSSGINLFVCDEAAAHLDSEGEERMLRLLRDLTSQGRSTFYITHSPMTQDLFDDRISVVKEGGVSRVEV